MLAVSTDSLAVEALIEENPLGISGLKIQQVINPAFLNGECLVLPWSRNVRGVRFFVLVELLPINSAALIPLPLEPCQHLRVDFTRCGRNQPAPC